MENIHTTKFEWIEKEKIAELKFPEEDVLTDEASKKERWNDLQRATTLGNIDKIKFKLYFADGTAHRYTETTIWGLTERYVILKQGVMIPVNRVLYIKF